MIESAVTDLPEPDSPTSATVSPRLMSNDTRSTHRLSRLPWRKQTDSSRTERRGCTVVSMAYPNVFRGSNASRTASPMKIRSDSMMATVKKPHRPSHGAWMLALAWLSISPSEGEPGGRPKPRKSSEVSVITDDDRMNGRNVMVATIALGNRWRNMMTTFDTPSARAAWMYSKLRPRRNSARTRPTSDTHEDSSRMPSSTKNPGTRTDEMIRSR